MGLSWQQGPLSSGAVGRFLVPDPLPARLLFVGPLRRRLRVRFGGAWIADSEQVLLFFEPGRYPVAYFPETDIASDVLERIDHSTRHQDLGETRSAAWTYPDAYPEVGRIANFMSFEPDIVTVHLDGKQLHLELGQSVVPHGPDRELTLHEVLTMR